MIYSGPEGQCAVKSSASIAVIYLWTNACSCELGPLKATGILLLSSHVQRCRGLSGSHLTVTTRYVLCLVEPRPPTPSGSPRRLQGACSQGQLCFFLNPISCLAEPRSLFPLSRSLTKGGGCQVTLPHRPCKESMVPGDNVTQSSHNEAAIMIFYREGPGRGQKDGRSRREGGTGASEPEHCEAKAFMFCFCPSLILRHRSSDSHVPGPWGQSSDPPQT